MINWQYYPKSSSIPDRLVTVIDIFKKNAASIDSSVYNLKSNDVLGILKADLQRENFEVELGKKKTDQIKIPVLFDKDGNCRKSFCLDALNKQAGIAIEVEAGQATENYRFLKDLYEACVMPELSYLVIAVRNIYRGHADFNIVSLFFEALFNSDRLRLPIDILIIGY